MTEEQPVVEVPEETQAPPDIDAPGQVDYPDPAFDADEDVDEPDVETPDEGEAGAGEGAPEWAA